ncbi:dihydrolipoyllysine-residue succinyltransferase 1 [Laccaria bicolor S238N-H82]|uniref:dihydrolipoyllysine-residue succinyltransferase n=1 Tax=Laccaria bicolor (strain S238N-H82 / ATCC MYA-4686) TaxID=486041 RepID=B0D495_LACBS|nr:dihydrolipoyllysine-residue succinyltransferase 1 [Laccaria bicolor S238N-H82]EDR10293.1 dihydrolipoyllysine-residue succinyltransferase 1 [Laccaria bicolor S238N-H82]|eukprot:XP_001878743.1 dihydrolipoyllysine-residue succinyltransferase 1 [Laccaria bicolor S238N-H82]
MLSSRVIAIARGRGLTQASSASLLRALTIANVNAKRAQFHSSNLLKAETIKVPQMAESISEGTLKSWSKQVGDTVTADEEVATIETDKIDVSVNAPQSGTIVKLLANEEDTVTVGQDLFVLEPGEVAASSPPPAKEEAVPAAEAPKESAEPAVPQPPSPSESAKTPETKEPVKAKEEKPVKKEEKKKEDKSKPAAAPRVAGSRNETRVKMNRMRLRIAERLKESQNAAASLTTFNEIDMSSLVEMRKKFKEQVMKDHEVKLGFMSAFAKACTFALQEIPAANASIEGEQIVYRDYVDLSVAVATPKGLVTPVVRNAEGMSFVEIEKEIAALGKKAKDGKLTLEDMAGGTFTISNGGVFGSLYGTPIINLPQSAVLGMHAIKDKAVVVDGQIVIRPIMIVALTYDHRLLDGREAVTFLVRVKEYLEDPRKMLLV